MKPQSLSQQSSPFHRHKYIHCIQMLSYRKIWTYIFLHISSIFETEHLSLKPDAMNITTLSTTLHCFLFFFFINSSYGKSNSALRKKKKVKVINIPLAFANKKHIENNISFLFLIFTALYTNHIDKKGGGDLR